LNFGPIGLADLVNLSNGLIESCKLRIFIEETSTTKRNRGNPKFTFSAGLDIDRD
jgi:hypothetical protein